MGNKPTSSADKQTSSIDKPASSAHKQQTSSRCITADHNFEVTGYSTLKGKGVGKFVSSSTFNVGGYGFYIRMSVFLCFCSGTTGVKMMFSLSLLEKDGKVGILRNTRNTFEMVPYTWGWDMFIHKRRLQELLSRNDDCLTIRCVLTVTKEDESTVMIPTVPESLCFTDCNTTTHNFEVTGYSLLQGLGAAGTFVSSSTFSVGGYSWIIMMYPNGLKDEYKPAYMSTFLGLCSGTTDVKVKYTFSLLEKDGKVSNLDCKTDIFESVGETRGCYKFIANSKLQELLSRNDDCVTIRCVLTVIKEPRTEDESTGCTVIKDLGQKMKAVMVPTVPESNLHTHFASMLKDEEGADVTFSVGDQLFSAHRCVLAARSTVFKTELSGQMKETTMKCIKIDDMEPAIFEALLHFIYTDSLPHSCDVDQNATLQHLLVAADQYGIDRLKAISEEKLCERIGVQTVATFLALAKQHHSVQLESACLRYLSSLDVLRAVKKTDGFKHLVASCPSIAMDILDML